MKNAELSRELKELRKKLPDVLGTLEANPQWYASIYIEKKMGKTYSANLKQTQVGDHANFGAVLRIYDGYSLFEQATDQMDIESLQKQAKNLVTRVKNEKHSPDLPFRPYTAPTWKDRLSRTLEPEISSQIPKGVQAKTEVHFGIPYQTDPTSFSTEERLKQQKGFLERVKKLASQAGIEEKDLSYIHSKTTIVTEEALFLDHESNLSQTLFRVSTGIMLMSGADRAFQRIGGLGGEEAIEVTDELFLELLGDLKSLKKAERLKPGRYKVLFSPNLSGVLAHEAFGHSQEGDTCARGRSKAWELHQTGEKVGNPLATIYNNPALYKNGAEKNAAWGSYFFDEEGWLAERQVLLDQGTLKAPMTNLTSSIRLGIPRSANGKRESWTNGVYTRQTNTYFSQGEHTLNELIAMMGDGFIAKNAAGGMEDPKGMGIQVGIQYLEEVKNGKPTGRFFKGPAGGDIQMTGYVPDVLNSILAKSKIEFNKKEKDQATHPHNDCGGCGKYHKELVYAGCGGPYMLLDHVTLG